MRDRRRHIPATTSRHSRNYITPLPQLITPLPQLHHAIPTTHHVIPTTHHVIPAAHHVIPAKAGILRTANPSAIIPATTEEARRDPAPIAPLTKCR